MSELAAGVTAGDEDLVAQARGDLRAFERLYLTYRSPVYRYLRSRCPGPEDAADLTALTFERVFHGLDRYRPEGSPRSWLLRIARNVAVDAARRRRPSVPLETVSGDDEPMAVHTPEDSFLAAERVRDLRRRVRQLPDVQRDAIALRYAAGLTAREIGSVIGKSEAATQKLMTRALASLKEAYDDQP